MRANDNGNEEAYRHTVERLLERVFAAAFLFFLNEWSKPENSQHADFQQALKMLVSFDVKSETTSEDSSSVIHNDVAVFVPRFPPTYLRKLLSGTSTLVCMSNVNAKGTGQVEFSYDAVIGTSTNSKIQNVDQVVGVGVNLAESRGDVTIQTIDKFLVEEYGLKALGLVWPLIATSHFAQVRFLWNDIVNLCLRTSLQDGV